MITAILPVSRVKYLERVLESLLKQTVKPNNLIVIFDGQDHEFLEVRNRIVELDFDNKICVPSTNKKQAFSIAERRVHIVNIHNHIRDLLPEPKHIDDEFETNWVFSIEDDGILPLNALERLMKVAEQHKDAGMITGVELGRWGVPYVGAWRVDDIYETKSLVSLENRTNEPDVVEEIDGCGLYCALIRQDYYKLHTFDTRNGIGPDVNLGLFLRQRGLKNYIDWGVHVTHLTKIADDEIEIKATDQSRVVTLTLLSGSVWRA